MITHDLWPFALKLANDIRNDTPTKAGLCPNEIYSGVKHRKSPLKSYHPFGCLVFVLDAKLQGGQKLPKWSPQARQGVYLGHSSHHYSNISWVLNIQNGHISP